MSTYQDSTADEIPSSMGPGLLIEEVAYPPAWERDASVANEASKYDYRWLARHGHICYLRNPWEGELPHIVRKPGQLVVVGVRLYEGDIIERAVYLVQAVVPVEEDDE